MPHGTPPLSPGRRTRSVALTSRDGLRLVGSIHLPPRPRADVVLVHGFAEHAGRYGELTDSLLDRGFACRLFDLRGHGLSEGPRGHVTRFADYVDDLERFLERTAVPRPTFLLGHSLGGLLCLDLVLRAAGAKPHPGRFAGLVLSSPYLGPAVPFPSLVRLVARLLSRLAPRLHLPLAPPPDGLSRDPEVVAAYVDDPLVVRTVTPRWAAEVFGAQGRVLERAGDITLPTLVLAGSEDPIAALDRTRALVDRLGSADKRLRVYEDFLHEVLNERGGERVLADLLAWLDRHLG